MSVHSSLGHLIRKIFRGLRSDRKGASQVVSTVILTAGVLAMSIAVLYWTYSMGKIGNAEYSESTLAASSAINERLSLEYATYNNITNSQLNLCILNWGKANNITIAHIIILDETYDYLGSNMGNIQLLNVTDNQPLPENMLHIGQDAIFTTKISVQLFSDELYYIRIVTERGRNFDFSFTP